MFTVKFKRKYSTVRKSRGKREVTNAFTRHLRRRRPRHRRPFNFKITKINILFS